MKTKLMRPRKHLSNKTRKLLSQTVATLQQQLVFKQLELDTLRQAMSVLLVPQRA